MIYANCVAFLRTRTPSLGKWLPLHASIQNQVAIFGVFHTWETNVQELTLWGIPAGAERATNQWRALDMGDLIPYRPAERDRMLSLNRWHSAKNSEEQETAALLFLAEKVRNRHNRLHPETLVDKIVLRREKWILTSDGYAAGRGNPTNDVTSLVLSADNPAP